jgi:hypothetical protein
MKELTVPLLSALTDYTTLSEVAETLHNLEKSVLSYAPWPGYPYKPDVSFSIAHGPSALFLQYQVKEKFIRAVSGSINEPVYKDTCVEFFISLDDGATYYNFEFNCIGTVLAGFGSGRESRELLSQATLEKIETEVCISRGASRIEWEITLFIPFETFLYHSLGSLQGKILKANFYKCGDELPEPHFLSWSNIVSRNKNLVKEKEQPLAH